MIKVENLQFSYQLNQKHWVRAIQDINLEIAEGEWVAILGANGSGKTTLSKLLGGLLLPSAGEIWLEGTNTKQQRDFLSSGMGLVLSRLDEQLIAPTVEEEVAFGPENLGLTAEEIRARVREALSWLGLEDYVHRSIAGLSGGERQRVVLASVLAMKPRSLILDEPTAFLSPQEAEQFWQLVQWLNREMGVSVIWFSQRVEQARGANRVLVLHCGRLQVNDVPARVFTQPQDWESWGLELPPVLRLAQALAAEGFPLSLPVFTVDELIQNIKPIPICDKPQ
jgi:energy-coupling factor transporter ATP-binding protein EcfA2